MKQFAALLCCLLMFGWNHAVAETNGELYLYGEQHNQQAILEYELKLWQNHYAEGFRHLFVELPYYTAEYLNQWIKAPDDVILEALYADWEGTAVQSPQVLDFYRQIKLLCPETLFLGTDVGHQYHTTGQRFLKELEQQGLTDTESYRLALECAEQGKRYYGNQDAVYRENQMSENLAQAWERIGCVNAMGIYGSAHTGIGSLNHTGEAPSMASQLAALYGARIHSEDLTELAKTTTPLSESKMELHGKIYRALYFGEQDLTSFSSKYTRRTFWRMEDAYADFEHCLRTGDVLPYNNYPMQISIGEVFVLDYTLADGSVERMMYLSCGNEWNGLPVTEGVRWE